MTAPHSGQRPASRMALFVPFILLLIGVMAWSGYWLLASRKLSQTLDQQRARLTTQGVALDWKSSTISGYPFRFFVELEDISLQERSGWTLATSRVKAMAAAYAPRTWVIVAPAPMTLHRPQGGDLQLSGDLLRASVKMSSSGGPDIRMEARKLVMTPAPGAQPFWLASVDRVDLALQPGPDDQRALLLKLTGGTARPGGLIGRIVEDLPLELDWQSSFNQASRLGGRSWPEAVKAWSGAGGQITVTRAELKSSKARLNITAPSLQVDTEGRLRGTIHADLGQVTAAVARSGTGLSLPTISGPDQPAALEARIEIKDGRIYLGPLPVGSAPRLY